MEREPGCSFLPPFRQQTPRASGLRAHYVLGRELGAGEQEGHCPSLHSTPPCCYSILITPRGKRGVGEGKRGTRRGEAARVTVRMTSEEMK